MYRFLFVFFAVPPLAVPPLAAAQPGAEPARVIPVEDPASGRWGFRAEGDTAWAIEPRFDGVWPWPHGLVPGFTEVEQDGRRGLVAHGAGTARLVLTFDPEAGEAHVRLGDERFWVNGDGQRVDRE